MKTLCWDASGGRPIKSARNADLDPPQKPGLKKDMDDPDSVDPAWKTTVNLVVAILCILLFAGGYFVINAIDKMRKAELCLESGNKACQRLNLPK